MSPLPFAGLHHIKQCQVGWNIFSKLLTLDPNEWCFTNGLFSEGLNPRPLNLKSSSLTTNPG
jgi:hypothetical protein